ncbi:MAG TPA: glycosyltransferase family 4 protein [Stellaceae bacterium]|nr:glycosyltransferase family 4 protein [Stellaceae bacterium]
MRIVICDYAGHPFQVELSRCLARRGHSVLHLYFADLRAPKGELTVLPGDPPNFHIEGIETGQAFDKGRFLQRRLLEEKVGRLMAKRAVAFAPDVVAGCNMALDAQKKLRQACAARGIAFVFWLQDLISRATYHFLSEKLGAPGRLIGRHYMRLESSLLRSSEAIVAISEKFLVPLGEWDIDTDKVRVVPNWAPLSQIAPVAKDNAWARRHGFGNELVALYSGTLGLKHDPALLLGLARAGVERGLRVVVVSEGAGAQWLEQEKRQAALENLVILPFQPMECYSEVLGASDILLAMIGREAAGFSVPSKILSYLAAGRPIVASIAADNDAAVAIKLAEAGAVVEPGENAAFYDSVLRLAADAGERQRLGRNARVFAEGQFDVEAKAAEFEETFAAALRPTAQKARRDGLKSTREGWAASR